MSGLRNDFDHIAILELIFDGNNIAVYLRTDTLITHIGMNTEGVIDRCRSLGKGFDITIRRKNVDLIGEEGHLQIGHEFPRILQFLLRFQ